MKLSQIKEFTKDCTCGMCEKRIAERLRTPASYAEQICNETLRLARVEANPNQCGVI